MKVKKSLPVGRQEKSKVKNIIYFCFVFLVLCSWPGCEAFVRKFTRKTKKTVLEEPVIQPQEYPSTALSREELYRDYFLFWETWADELLNFLKEDANAKKQKACANEALDNLTKMQSLLNEEKANALQGLIEEFNTFRNILSENRLNRADISYLRNKLERVKAKVHRGFIFSKVNKDLK